tara:strand:- start:9725 stop:10264 length:540 start_codon:yes stop_codon:yes gene_type:complete
MSNKNSNNVNITNVYGDNNEVGNKSTKSNEEESTAKFIWLLIAALLSAAAAITLGSIGDLGEEQAKKSMFEQHLKNKEYLHSEIESMTKRLSEEAKKRDDITGDDLEEFLLVMKTIEQNSEKSLKLLKEGDSLSATQKTKDDVIYIERKRDVITRVSGDGSVADRLQVKAHTAIDEFIM